MVMFYLKKQRDAASLLLDLVGPVPLTAADVLMALNMVFTGEGGKAGKAAYRSCKFNHTFFKFILY